MFAGLVSCFAIRVTVPRSLQAVSNGAITREVPEGRRKTVWFRETPPLSTYLVALAVGELEASKTATLGPTQIRVWHTPGKRRLTRFGLEAAHEASSHQNAATPGCPALTLQRQLESSPQGSALPRPKRV